VIFGKILDEPWYANNASRVQGFPACPDDVELAWSALLPVPGSIKEERPTQIAFLLG